MKSASEDEIIAHCEAVAREIPLVGFYLQPAVGGVILSADFWRRFAAIDNVIAIKIAPFNRYRTLDVLRGVAAAGALDRVALYTGNDDHILLDLTLPFDLRDKGVTTRAYFKGGLLGHWSVWTASAIKQFEMCKAARGKDTRAGRSAGARCPRHRLQQRVLRRRQQFPRLHRRLPRNPAAAGADAGNLVPRSRRRPQPRPDAARSTASAASTPTSPTTTSSPPICRNGWHDGGRALHPPAQRPQGLSRRRARNFSRSPTSPWTCSEGELVSLVGPSGCGKTTVLKILAGLHDADGGTIQIGNAKTPFDPGARYRHGVPAGAAAEMADHPRQRAAAGRDRRPADEGGARRARATCSIWSGLPATRTNIRSNCPAACSSAPRSRAPSSTIRN